MTLTHAVRDAHAGLRCYYSTPLRSLDQYPAVELCRIGRARERMERIKEKAR